MRFCIVKVFSNNKNYYDHDEESKKKKYYVFFSPFFARKNILRKLEYGNIVFVPFVQCTMDPGGNYPKQFPYTIVYDTKYHKFYYIF